jgi:threonine dehydratase
MLSWYYTFV